MNTKSIFLWTIVIILVFISAFFLIKKDRLFKKSEVVKTYETKYIKIAGQTLKVDLASTPQTQEQGLSGRSGLKENEGMLFVFENSGIYPFWMKDMNFSIDIIWIDENLKVVYIEKNASPESYPKTFGSNKNAKYVLEVVSNFAEKNNLKEGDSIKFLK